VILMLREVENESLEQAQLQNEQLTPKYEFAANQLLAEQTQLQSQRRTMEFESIFTQPFVQALGRTDRGIDYAGSCDCDAGCFNCNCNCVIVCT